MLVCPKCNNEQESGKFCGVCGTQLQAAGQTVAPDVQPAGQQPQENIAQGHEAAGTAPLQPQQPQQAQQAAAGRAAVAASVQPQQAPPQSAGAAENVKNVAGNYWAYFLELIKNPTRAFNQTEDQFVNGLITLALYAVAFALSINFSIGDMFSVTINMMVLNLVSISITFFSAFAMIKAAKHPMSFKLLISQYGGILAPFTALNVIAMLGALIGSSLLTLLPLGISGVFTFLFIPVLVVYEKVSQVNKQGQNIYLSLATVVLIAIGFLILGIAAISWVFDTLNSMFMF